MSNLTINSLEEFEKYLFDNVDNEKAFANIELGDFFNYSVKIEGSSWNGLIDIRQAELITKVQNTIYFLYAQTYNISEKDARNRISVEKLVKVETKQGSWIGNFLTKDILTQVLNNMGSIETAIITGLGILALFGIFGIPAIIKAKKGNPDMQKALEVIEKAIENNPKIIEAVEAPNKAILKHLGENDTVTIANNPPLIREQLKERFPISKPRIPTISHYVDGSYTVKELFNDEDNYTKTATLMSDDYIALPAIIELNEEDSGKLANAWNTYTPIDLQVNVSIRNYEIKEARIVSLGLRGNAKNLKDLMTKPTPQPQLFSDRIENSEVIPHKLDNPNFT